MVGSSCLLLQSSVRKLEDQWICVAGSSMLRLVEKNHWGKLLLAPPPHPSLHLQQLCTLQRRFDLCTKVYLLMYPWFLKLCVGSIDCSLLGSSCPWVLQAKYTQVGLPFPSGSVLPHPRDQPLVSCICCLASSLPLALPGKPDYSSQECLVNGTGSTQTAQWKETVLFLHVNGLCEMVPKQNF